MSPWQQRNWNLTNKWRCMSSEATEEKEEEEYHSIIKDTERSKGE